MRSKNENERSGKPRSSRGIGGQGARCSGRHRRPRNPRLRRRIGEAQGGEPRDGGRRVAEGRRTDRPRRKRGPPRVSGHGHDDVIAPGLEPEEGLGPQEAEPPDLLAADNALEQERTAHSARSGQRPRRVSVHHRSTGGKPGRREQFRPIGRIPRTWGDGSSSVHGSRLWGHESAIERTLPALCRQGNPAGIPEGNPGKIPAATEGTQQRPGGGPRFLTPRRG